MLAVLLAAAASGGMTTAPAANLASFELGFVPNQGQWNSEVRFGTRTPGLQTWITDQGMVLDLYRLRDVGPGKRPSREGHVIRQTIIGARGSTIAVAPREGRVSYFRGSKAVSDLSTSSEVLAKNVLPGIDVRYMTVGSMPRYDLLVRPGADPRAFRMRIEGAQKTWLDREGLAIQTRLGVLRQANPIAYTVANGRKNKVAARYELHGNVVSFQVGKYDRSRTLIIDPLVFSTFLGGSAADEAAGVSVSVSGESFVTGTTASSDFPATVGAYDTTLTGSTDLFVVRLKTKGEALIYATYLGGEGAEQAGDIDVDREGVATIVGTTFGAGYPTTLGCAFPTLSGTSDAVVTRLNPTGTSLVWSTHFGGASADDGRDIKLDGQGIPHFVGQTFSNNMPTGRSSWDMSYNGGGDAYKASLSTNGVLVQSCTYIGGSNEDAANGVDVLVSGASLTTGYTLSSGFPTTNGAYDTSHNGMMDAFAIRLDANATTAAFSTLLGGKEDDIGHAASFGPEEDAFVVGQTNGDDFPTASAFDASHNGVVDAFVTRFGARGDMLKYSTYLGGKEDDMAYGLDVDKTGTAYATGGTSSDDFPTTASAFDKTRDGGSDVFLTLVRPNGLTLRYSSFFGGKEDDTGRDVHVRTFAQPTVVGGTSSAGFPVTPGVFQGALNGASDGFVFRLGLRKLGKSIVLDGDMKTTRRWGYWTTQNGAITGWQSVSGLLAANWKLGGFGDLNEDGVEDAMVWNVNTRQMGGYLMNGPTITGWTSIGTTAADWAPVALADANADGQKDIVVYNPVLNKVGAYLLKWNGSSTAINGWLFLANVPTGWTVAGLVDIDGNDENDLLVRRTSDGRMGAYLRAGNAISGWASMLTIPTDWAVVGLGDFDETGSADILVMRTTDRRLGTYLMNGPAVLGWRTFGTVGTAWQVAGVGDF